VKTKISILFLSSALGVMTIISSPSSHDDGAKLSMSNLEALQSSAGEAWCDQSTQSACTIRVGDITGSSTGKMHVQL